MKELSRPKLCNPATGSKKPALTAWKKIKMGAAAACLLTVPATYMGTALHYYKKFDEKSSALYDSKDYAVAKHLGDASLHAYNYGVGARYFGNCSGSYEIVRSNLISASEKTKFPGIRSGTARIADRIGNATESLCKSDVKVQEKIRADIDALRAEVRKTDPGVMGTEKQLRRLSIFRGLYAIGAMLIGVLGLFGFMSYVEKREVKKPEGDLGE
jgi:hypothetical protein